MAFANLVLSGVPRISFWEV